MAGTIGTNITPDGGAEYELFNKIFTTIENQYLNRGRTEEARNAKIISNHISMGGSLDYKLMAREYEKGMEETLRAEGIPFTKIPDNVGNILFITRDCDRKKFAEAQKKFFNSQTNFVSQITMQEMEDILTLKKENNLVRLTFDSKYDFCEAQIKLYGNGVVCALGAPGSNSFYVNPGDLYKEGGEDLVSFELDWALNQTMNDELFGGGVEQDTKFQQVRDAQAEYDVKVTEAFAMAAYRGENKVLIDASGQSGVYLECKGGAIHAYAYDSQNKVWTLRHTYDSKETDFRAVVAKYGFDINNAIVIDGLDKRNILGNTPEGAWRWSEKWASEPDAEISPGYKRQLRPVGNFNIREIEINNAKKSLQKAMKAVEEKARQRINATNGSKTSAEKRKLLKKEIIALLHENSLFETPEMVAFVNSSTKSLTEEDKKEWISNLRRHLANENEYTSHEVHISEETIDEAKNRAFRERENERENDRENESEKDRDDDDEHERGRSVN